MFINNVKLCFIRPKIKWIIFNLNQRENSSSSTKLTSSYYHHISSIPLLYKTISQSFDEIANKYSNHECYIFRNEQKRYTYKAFKDEVDNLAASLLELGFEKNDRLAVWLPSTSENVATTFAASKLGLIKVNINPAYVGRELEYCINKVGCKGIILSQQVKMIESLAIFRRLVPEIDQHSISHELSLEVLPTLKHVILTGQQRSIRGFHSYNDLVQNGEKLSHEKLNQRQTSINPDSPVAIFFTSGTTGQPKAATLTNFGMLNLIRHQWKHLGRFFTRHCVPVPIFHIFGEVAGVLNVAVAKCTIVFPAILPDTLSTIQAIHDEKCTSLIGAPIIFRNILSHPDRKKYDLSSLEYAEIGASPMHIDFLTQLEKEIPIRRIAQGYGMTKNAGSITNGMWAGDDDPKRRKGSLGRCIEGLEIKIADKYGNSLPIGQQGEIWARGYPVMIGYYNDPEKTKETLTSAGWLRTGDHGKMDEDGYVYYVGRQKEMVIRGGINIYPTEIENILVEHPSIAEAQVFGIPDERYGEEICAWIKLKPDVAQCHSKDITKFLQDKLAFFKIPKHIQFVNQFITTPTGKVQKFKQAETLVNELKEVVNKK